MNTTDPRIERIMTAADFVRTRLSGKVPSVGIVLGSGLGKLADSISDPVVIPYKDIPGFPVSTAVGHKGNFIAGTLGGKNVIAAEKQLVTGDTHGRWLQLHGAPFQKLPCFSLLKAFVGSR